MEKWTYIIVPLASLVVCQLLKTTIEAIATRKFSFKRLFNGTGGIPSTHVTFASSVTFIIGLTKGFYDPLVGLGMVFTFIAAYDAIGVRRETEKQARVLNQITTKLKDIKLKDIVLKEDVGHNVIEVLAGFILGITVASAYYLLIFS